MVSKAPPIGSSLSDVFYFCLLLLYPRYLLVIMVLVNLLLLKSYLFQEYEEPVYSYSTYPGRR